MLVAVLALAAIAAFFSLRRSGATPALRPKAARVEPPAPVPRIDLARLDRAAVDDRAGRRDLFAYGARALPEPAPAPAVVHPAPAPAASAGGGATASADVPAGPPPLPPLNLRYIGSVENARGVKVAVLVTDKREVLTGQAGEVVANRYRIARIGIESVDLEDVGTGQSRRLPLRGGG